MYRNIKNIMVTFLIIVIGVLPLGCSKSEETPNIFGKIIEVYKNGNSISILVEGDSKNSEYDKAVVSIIKDSILYLGKNNAKGEDLKKGQVVEVVFTGPVRESYPVQADAKIVTIIEE